MSLSTVEKKSSFVKRDVYFYDNEDYRIEKTYDNDFEVYYKDECFQDCIPTLEKAKGYCLGHKIAMESRNV
jgi:hypothetical protein